MNIQIEKYNQHDRQDILKLFDDFQDFLIGIDPLGRLRRPAGYGEVALQKTLNEVEDHKGTFLVAKADQRLIGFVAAVILLLLELDFVHLPLVDRM